MGTVSPEFPRVCMAGVGLSQRERPSAAGVLRCDLVRDWQAILEKHPARDYALRFGIKHLVEAGQESTAAGLLSAFDFLNAKVATGLTFDLVRDYASVSEALGIQGRSTTAQFHAWNLFVIQQSHHLSRFPLHFTQQVINADDLAVAQSLLSMSSIPEIGKAERPYLHRLYKPPIEEDQPWVQTFAGRTASISSVACDQDGLIDVTDDEWAFVAPHLTLMTQDAHPDDTRRAPARLPSARGLQRPALDGSRRCTVAYDCP